MYLVPSKPVRYWPAPPAAKRPVQVKGYPVSIADAASASPMTGSGAVAAGRVAVDGDDATLEFRRRRGKIRRQPNRIPTSKTSGDGKSSNPNHRFRKLTTSAREIGDIDAIDVKSKTTPGSSSHIHTSAR